MPVKAAGDPRARVPSESLAIVDKMILEITELVKNHPMTDIETGTGKRSVPTLATEARISVSHLFAILFLLRTIAYAMGIKPAEIVGATDYEQPDEGRNGEGNSQESDGGDRGSESASGIPGSDSDGGNSTDGTENSEVGTAAG